MVRLVFPVPLGALITVLPVDALTVNLLVFTAKLPVTPRVDCAVNAPVIMAVVETVRAPVSASVAASHVRLAWLDKTLLPLAYITPLAVRAELVTAQVRFEAPDPTKPVTIRFFIRTDSIVLSPVILVIVIAA